MKIEETPAQQPKRVFLQQGENNEELNFRKFHYNLIKKLVIKLIEIGRVELPQ
jgi:hypothetical protein